MLAQLRTGVLMIVVMTVLMGLAYPLAMTGIGQVVFRHKAEARSSKRTGR
jgi:K+-transporting ATPase ATPase C chain